jgi:hypothetical protein
MEWRRSRLPAAGLALLAWLASAPAGSAAAQESVAKPDKSGYSLFNPTPAESMRDFSTDRPPKANSPYTVDAGHFQYEADLVSYLYDRFSPGRTTTRQWVVGDPTVKLGLTNRVDAELQLAPYNNLRVTQRGRPATTVEASGFGDVTPRAKVNLFGNDGGDAALALLPYVKLSTGARGLGNNRVEGGVIAPLSLTLPDNWTAILMTEIDALANSGDAGRHTNFLNLVNLSHPLATGLTGYVELFANTASGGQVAPTYTLDLALTYLLAPDIQLDLGTNVGLNKTAPDLQAYVGLSQRF